MAHLGQGVPPNHRWALTIGSVGASPTCPGPVSTSLQRLDGPWCSGHLGSTGGQVEVLTPLLRRAAETHASMGRR
jgi:hypothetical protein